MAWQLYVATAPNGKRYVGITSKTVEWREKSHRYDARKGLAIPFHKALRKYGDEIVFRLAAEGSREEILALEIETIERLKTRDRRYGYNVRIGGDVAATLTPEVAAKVSASKRGKPTSSGSRAALAFGHTPEARAKATASNTGQKRSPEFCARMKERMRLLLLEGWRPVAKGRICVTDGVVNRVVDPAAIPDGFRKGQTRAPRPSRTLEQSTSFSAAVARGWIGRRERQIPKPPAKWELAGVSRTTWYRRLRNASEKED